MSPIEEYSNAQLDESNLPCSLLTIRGFTPWWTGIGQLQDNRERIDAHGISGVATNIYNRTCTASYMNFNGAIRCGDYIYFCDRTDDGAPTWPNNAAVYHHHIIEYCISTGEHIDIDMGAPAGTGNFRSGDQYDICVIEERKILVFDERMERYNPVPDRHIRILNFKTQEIEFTTTIDEINGDMETWCATIAVIKDTNNGIHLFAICNFENNAVGNDGYDYSPGHYGVALYHKNYTTNAAWERMDTIVDSQSSSVFSWAGRLYDIVGNRYLVIHSQRLGSYYDVGHTLRHVYLEEIVYDCITGTINVYDYESPWAASALDMPWIPYSDPDNTNNKLYSNVYYLLSDGDARNMEFDPATGVFTTGTITPADSYKYQFYMSSETHAYFFDDDDNNIYKADTVELLCNYNIQHDEPSGFSGSEDFMCVSNLLDYNGGGNPLVWYYDNVSDTLKALDIITGTLVFNQKPTGFVSLVYTYVVHLGDSLLLVTVDQHTPNYQYMHLAMNFWLVT